MPEIIIVSTILLVTIVLFAWGRFAPEGVALSAALALFLTDLIDHQELLKGFANPAIVTIAGLLILGNALERAGIIRHIADFLQKLAGKGETRLLLTSTIAPGLLSGIINIVAAVSVFIPALLRIALKTNIQPARLLLPMAYVAMAGASLTLIGASHNLVVNDILQEKTGESLGFFSFTLLGLALVTIAVIYSLLTARWLLGKKEDSSIQESQTRALIKLYALHERIWELTVKEGIKKPINFTRENGLAMVALIRKEGNRPHISGEMEFNEGDTLLVSGRCERAKKLTDRFAALELVGSPSYRDDFSAGDSELIEVLVPPHSAAAGKTAQELELLEKHHLHLIGLWRNEKPIRTDIDTLKLQAGDALLLYGQKRYTRQFNVSPDFLWLKQPSKTSVTKAAKKRAMWIALIFASVIGVAALNLLPVSIAALGGAILVVAIGALSVKQAYAAIQWDTLILIGAMLAFGPALTNSGASSWFAELISDQMQAYGPYAILSAIAITTFLLTQALHNAAAAIIMTPVALQVASQMGYQPQAFAVVVLLSASLSLLLPVGHPAPLLVQRPGSYSTKDYMRFGIGLGILSLPAIIGLTPLLFPLTSTG
ncbi:MAG: Citrate transporter [uncultured Thiotrichaceae bacterium]|uniref:Citrate transporter n=1 Tax=uncultured Thiotrichaceae bacterium TaxID=298394 RepID=A0A6S6SJM3_9GAMM|nr:MAG: Citrate transporter [uncultured Thiotrichaceae bacterium]